MTLRRPRFDVEGRDWPYRRASRFVAHDAGRLHVMVLGTGPVLLLLHGTGASGHSFRELVALLLPRFTVVTVDLPGQGFSSCADGFQPTASSMASVIIDVMTELKLAPQVVVGHSSGAAVAVILAVHQQDDLEIRGDSASNSPLHTEVELVVGISAALMPLQGVAGTVMRSAAWLLALSELAARFIAWRARMPGSVERLVRSTGSLLDEAGVDLYRRLAGTPGHVAGVLRMLATWDPGTALEGAARLKARTLFIAGADDLAVSVEDQRRGASRFVDAVFQVIERAGHLVHEEQPHVVAQLIHDAADALGLPPAPADGGRA